MDTPTNIVYLEDLLKKYQAVFREEGVEGDRKGSSMRLLYSVAQLYTADLQQAKRPVAVMEFLRRLIAIFKDRMEFNERFTESWIVSQQLSLYQMMKEFDNNPVERWELIQEVKSMVERITPESWDDNNFRSLRDLRAQIVQYYAAEEGDRYKDPMTRASVLERLVASHEEVIRLETGFKTASAEETRSRSLRAICGFKEEQGRDFGYQVYATELHNSMTEKFKLAKSKNNLTCIIAYELLSSYVVLCKAHARSRDWEKVVEVATNGLNMGKDIGWDEDNRAHVEICQLLVYRSRGYLVLEQPISALDDAREAVREANAIPWNEEHPDEEVRAEYPKEYRKYRWQNFAQLNLTDTVYDRLVLHPEELFGLVQAEHGLNLYTSSSLPDPMKDFYETQYRRKKIRALMRLERWQDVLAECRVLLSKSVQLLSSSDISHLKDIVGQIVETCDDACDCLAEMDKVNLSYELEDETESFAEFVDGKIPLESYITRARRLRRNFESVYKKATTADPRITAEVKHTGTPPLSRVTRDSYTK